MSAPTTSTAERRRPSRRRQRAARAALWLLRAAPSLLTTLYRNRRVWRLWRVTLTQPRSQRGLVKRLMSTSQPPHTSLTDQPATNGAHPTQTTAPQPEQPQAAPARPPRIFIIVRHGQSTFNVENRLPGQLPGVLLTDEGRRQAQRAAVALSGMRLTSVIASPLERARETAEIIARGWALPVRTDPRLMDTNVAFWAGQKVDDLNKTDPRWKAFVEHPTAPPEGVESLNDVQLRSVAVIEDALRDESLGDAVVIVAHADVIKLILAHYTAMPVDGVRFVSISNASISALAFGAENRPHLLATNWTALPGWLFTPTQPPAQPQPTAAPTDATATQDPGGVVEPSPNTPA